MQRVCLLVLTLALAVPTTALAAPPGQSNAFGKSLAEWMEIYFTRVVTGDSNDRVGKVLLMPLPQGEYVSGNTTLENPLVLAGELEVTVGPGTPFVMPVATWAGETYSNGSSDPVLPAEIFTTSNALVKIDGKTVLDSERSNFESFYFGPVEFVPPLFYDEPSDYGSVGVTYLQGIGFAHPPLSKGTHTMTLISEIKIPDYNLHVIFMNTWTITVTK
jgi:hypothetical protein